MIQYLLSGKGDAMLISFLLFPCDDNGLVMLTEVSIDLRVIDLLV